MNSKQVEGFLHVAKTRNITKSAQELYLTPPTLSRHIAQMEDEFGFPLFERGANTLKLAPGGEIMLETLSRMDKMLHQAIARGRLIQRTKVERIAVGSMRFFNKEFYLQKYFEKYMSGNPTAEISLYNVDPSELRPQLDNGILDICFHTDPSLFKGSDYQNRVICPTRLYAIIGKTHPLAEKAKLSFEDLEVEIRLETASYLEPEIEYLRDSIIERYGRLANTVIMAKSCESQNSLVRLGRGYAIRNSAYTQRGDEEFLQIPIDIETGVDIVATWRSENQNPSLKRFISTFEHTD